MHQAEINISYCVLFHVCTEVKSLNKLHVDENPFPLTTNLQQTIRKCPKMKLQLLKTVVIIVAKEYEQCLIYPQ